MYCRLLEQTVRRLKNEPDPTPPAVHVDLDVAAHVPAHYIASDRSRIDVYRRVASCRTAKDLSQLERDLVDAFGEFPKEVQRLLELAEIRVLGRWFGINSVSLRAPDVVFAVDSVKDAQAAFADAPGTVRAPDAKTIYLRLPPAYLEPPTLVSVLRNMLARAKAKLERVQC
jgi:transcription-repair coupling factor (superfamily II helicase)